METTLEYAGSHFPELLKLVASGEEVVLRSGSVAVARIIPLTAAAPCARPQVGQITSERVRWTPESFAPLDEEGMKELGFS